MSERTPYLNYTAACPGCGVDISWLCWGERVGEGSWELHLRVDCERCDTAMAAA